MTDPIDTIRQAYFELLSNPANNLPPVFDDIAPQDQSYPYIILSSQSATPVRLGNCYHFRSLITIRVVTAYNSIRKGSRLESGDISAKIITLVNQQSLSMSNTQKIDHSLTLNFTQNPYTDGQYTVRERILQYQDLISTP